MAKANLQWAAGAGPLNSQGGPRRRRSKSRCHPLPRAISNGHATTQRRRPNAGGFESEERFGSYAPSIRAGDRAPNTW